MIILLSVCAGTFAGLSIKAYFLPPIILVTAIGVLATNGHLSLAEAAWLLGQISLGIQAGYFAALMGQNLVGRLASPSLSPN
jgi:hypothetical protein